MGALHHCIPSPEGNGGMEGARRFGILCNDSFWYCEVMRGNRYNVLHVFSLISRDQIRIYRRDGHPVKAATASSTSSGRMTSPGKKGGRARGTVLGTLLSPGEGSPDRSIEAGAAGEDSRDATKIEMGDNDTFWIRDSQLAVQLRAAGTGADELLEWWSALMEAQPQSAATFRPLSKDRDTAARATLEPSLDFSEDIALP